MLAILVGLVSYLKMSEEQKLPLTRAFFFCRVLHSDVHLLDRFRGGLSPAPPAWYRLQRTRLLFVLVIIVLVQGPRWKDRVLVSAHT